MPLSRELVMAVRSRINERPDIPEVELAVELNASEEMVITALPVIMRRKAKPADLGAIFKRAIRWQNVRITPAASKSLFSTGQAAPLDIGSVWFIARPLDEGKSYAIYLYDKNGSRVVSLYVGSDRNGHICAEDKADFEAMWEYFGVTPQPHIHCKGCGACTCKGRNQSLSVTEG